LWYTTSTVTIATRLLLLLFGLVWFVFVFMRAAVRPLHQAGNAATQELPRAGLKLALALLHLILS
jgi:uncharacterized membrane protein